MGLQPRITTRWLCTVCATFVCLLCCATARTSCGVACCSAKLIIRCRVVVERPLRLASHLEQFVCSSRFSDSSVVCADDVVLPVHRALVEFRCSHFFDEVHNIRSDTARIVLHYMYTDSVPLGLDSRTSAAVAAVAADLMLTRLSRLCARADRKPVAVPHGTLESDIAALAERNPHATVTVLSKQGPPGCTGHAYIVARLRSLVTQLDEGRTDIRVDDLSAAALRVLWQYLYSEWCVDGALWDVLELMQWAERHFEDELARACEDCLLRLEITPESLHGLAAAGQTGVVTARAVRSVLCREHRDECRSGCSCRVPTAGRQNTRRFESIWRWKNMPRYVQ